MSDLDAQFAAMAEEAERKEQERASNRGKGGGYTREYEHIEWSGLEKNVPKIVRFIGEAPDFGTDFKLPNPQPYDAKIVVVNEILTDKGSKAYMVLPRKADDAKYIIWRIIDRVCEVKWVKKTEEELKPGEKLGEVSKKVYVHEARHPNLVARVLTSGLPESDNNVKYGLIGYGMGGREVFMVNVIDRSRMAWHQEHKHTLLLSKEVRKYVTKEGKPGENAEKGIPAYGFTNLLSSEIIAYYKNWTKFDTKIEKTGLTSPSYRVANVSKNIEALTKFPDLQKLVVVGDITPEEASWEKYNISKLFAVSTYQKWWNSIGEFVKEVDASLGTKYEKEFESLIEEEKKKFEEIYGNDSPKEEPAKELTTVTVEQHVPTTTRDVKVEVTVTSEDGFSLLKGLDKLTEEEKADIKSVSNTDGKVAVTYDAKHTRLAPCPACKVKSPVVFSHCPACGENFNF